MSLDGDKSSEQARPGVMGGLRAFLRPAAVLGLLLLAGIAAGGQLCREVHKAREGPTFSADYLERFDTLLAHLPTSGPLVEVDPGSDIAFLSYLTYEEVFKSYEQGMADPVLRGRIDASAIHFNLTQQALVPRVVLLPTPRVKDLYDRTKLILGNYDRAEDVPDLSSFGLEEVAQAGHGIVLWRRR